MSKRRRHRYRPYNRFSLDGKRAMRWCIDCGSVEQVATYEGGRVGVVADDGAVRYLWKPVPGSFKLIDTRAYDDADPEWCPAKKWERRKAHRFARRDAR